MNVGSSPLARGLPLTGSSGTGSPRIIPARAGFTQDRLGAVNTEHGSSPLARGLRRLSDHLGMAARIIPARAGFTNPSAFENGIGKDHPRSRGVYQRFWR